MTSHSFICRNIAPGDVRALPCWFAFTGCDSVLMFAGRREKTASSVWQKYPEVTQVFRR